jgi:hypothetical protein
MAEKGRGEPSRRATTPEDFTTTASSQFSSGDYSYTVELVGSIQNQLGKLTEAVESLKAQAKEHGDELKNIAKDIHAAKMVISVVGGLALFIGGVIAWLINTYISTHPPR